MSNTEIKPGLYIVKRPAQGSGKNLPVGIHYGLVDIGNVLEYPGIDGNSLIVLHKNQKGIQVEGVKKSDNWTLISRVNDLEGAKQRLREANNNPHYSLFGNNCEHFTNYIAKGENISVQASAIRAGLVIGTLVFLSYAWK